MFFTTRAFWTDFAERVVSTGAAGALTVVTLASFGIFDVKSWHDVAAAAGVSALISALKAFALQRTTTATIAPATPAPAAPSAPLSTPVATAVPVPVPVVAASDPAAGVTYALAPGE